MYRQRLAGYVKDVPTMLGIEDCVLHGAPTEKRKKCKHWGVPTMPETRRLSHKHSQACEQKCQGENVV